MNEESNETRPLATEEFLHKAGEALFHGVPPWRNTWCIRGGPRSLASDSRYQGVNRLHLSMVMMDHPFSDPRFLTRKQAEDRGYSIQEDAVPTPIYFTRFGSTRDDEQTGARRLFVHTLYNAEEVEGVPTSEQRRQAFDAVSAIARLVQGSGAELRHAASVEVPHYDVNADAIVMPTRDRFGDVTDYHAALLHELVHATGHAKREGRFEVYKDRHDLAVEELRAEIATAFLGQDLGMGLSSRHAKDHDRYVVAWHSLLRDQPVRFLRCVHEAERIAAHVIGLDRSLAVEVGQAATAERVQAQKLPPTVVRAAEELVGPDLQVIAPRRDFSEYVGPVVGERQGFAFQRINDRYAVAHRTSVPDMGAGRILSIRYRDQEVEVSQELRDSTKSASVEEVAELRKALGGKVSGRVWRAAFTRHNQYVGVLEHVGEDFVLQRTGRGALVVHRRDAFPNEAEQGARVRIRYENHAAEVCPAPRRHRRTRGDDVSLGR